MQKHEANINGVNDEKIIIEENLDLNPQILIQTKVNYLYTFDIKKFRSSPEEAEDISNFFSDIILKQNLYAPRLKKMWI